MSVLDTLANGEIEIEGRLVDSSNGAHRVFVGPERIRAVYKPIRAEQPLWDFPDGSLAAREVATFAVAEAAGWPVVPETVLRDGPFGPGSVQRWVGPADGQEFTLVRLDADVPPGYLPVVTLQTEDGAELVLSHRDDPVLRSIAALDAVVNNTDRKGSHLLLDGPADGSGRVFGIDHGLTFHQDPKLRTVVWGWIDEPLAAQDLAALARLSSALTPESDLSTTLLGLLSADEVLALRARVGALLATGTHPAPGDWHPLPWPLW